MSRVRALMGAPGDAYDELWRSAAGLGFFALGLAESVGGAGYAITEEMVLFEELGRTLAPGPWLGSVLAVENFVGSKIGPQCLRALLEPEEQDMAAAVAVVVCLDSSGFTSSRSRLSHRQSAD